MDEKLKSENMQKKSSFQNGREQRYSDHIFIQICFRMHHFVVKFSKFSSQAARVIEPPNQNPADAVVKNALEILVVGAVCGAGSMQLKDVHPSVCLSVPFARCCCWLLGDMCHVIS